MTPCPSSWIKSIALVLAIAGLAACTQTAQLSRPPVAAQPAPAKAPAQVLVTSIVGVGY